MSEIIEDCTNDFPSIQTLYDELDALWILYLEQVDLYQIAQHNLRNFLSKGALQLSQANFESRGRRYGRDQYDERAAAILRTRISPGADRSAKVTISVLDIPETTQPTAAVDLQENDHRGDKSTEDLHQVITSGLPTPRATPEPEVNFEKEINRSQQTGIDEGEEPIAASIEMAETSSRPLRDPIRQFGLLVPRSLHSARHEFSSAISNVDTVTQAVNAARRMRAIELEVRKLRKVIRKGTRAVDKGDV